MSNETQLIDIAESVAKICGRFSLLEERDRECSLTRRDRFAIAALPAVMASIDNEGEDDTDKACTMGARIAYQMADAMIAERVAKPIRGRKTANLI